MSLTLACELAADLSDLDLVRLREFVRRTLEARGFHEPVKPLPRHLDELEPRRSTMPSRDTVRAPAPPHNPEDDGG